MIADAAEQLSRWWAPALAFVAGLVSFASPCVFPLVPGYLSFVAGDAAVEQARRERLAPILLFIGGFTLVFTLEGAFAATFVKIFEGTTAQVIAGVVVVVVGLLLIGFAVGRGGVSLYADRRPFLGRVRPGVAGALPLGMAFAAGWTPCIGPVLAAILVLAASAGGAARGAFLLICYSLGLGVPFLLIGLGIQWLSATAGWIRRNFRAISVVSGSLLVVVGVLLMTGAFTRYLVTPLLRFTPGL
ncbi:MAG TPA: cytochrome c biogenesis protein CcdA [Actinomycetota bacterium]|nr:cytochrome c biogenesis protein CcdA [Actinomycetota bacterium]